MFKRPGRVSASACLLILGALVSRCSPQPDTRARPPASPLIGDMRPVVSAKEFMKYTIDPITDNILAPIALQSASPQ